MANDKNKGAPPPDRAAGWKNALDDEPESSGVQADIARKILAMNPALREQGIDTRAVVEKSKARTPGGAATTTAPVGQGAAAAQALAEIKKQVVADDQRAGAKLQQLQQERASLKELACERFCRWLMANDPELRSPVTQLLLEEQKKDLARIGFSVPKYHERRKRK